MKSVQILTTHPQASWLIIMRNDSYDIQRYLIQVVHWTDLVDSAKRPLG
jgi:hypothetical protein